MLTVLSVFLGNDPVILSGTAFLVYYTKVSELDPISWLMSEFAAANTASMVLFVGNPTNVVICEGFGINNAGFTGYTILPFLGCIVFCFIALAIQFRKQKYIPRVLHNEGDLDVRSVLLDPIGAWVGSIILGSCLIVIIVVSFVHVDVWIISLPFAGAKFIYDIAWDHYRYVRKIPMRGQARSDEDLGQAEDDVIMEQLRRHVSPHHEGQQPATGVETSDKASGVETRVNTRNNTAETGETYVADPTPTTSIEKKAGSDAEGTLLRRLNHLYVEKRHRFAAHFPTFYTALPRLPFALVPFAFSQFILIEALAHQGWIDVFARWLVIASSKQIYPTIWLIGVLGVILCNVSGTNIGATILLTKIVRAADMPVPTARAAAIALAVASNIGAVSFTFSASLAGLLWRQILEQKGIHVRQRTFAYWNAFPLVVMTAVGLGIVCAEMAVLYR
ncbi:hypothetical protein D9611_007770 [Ephemerocybe angulata]|uniref:Citrate transporter-like domain-containing protein n=1 Tax=Ephemerocybe angulata TaxID=980116 RepID=A0A8H5FKL3_9AGAR|nr:hypothetical protein D9611_007770 [Tulosesus angulatus]